MKGIILAGGTGSRLQPLTRVTNKCLLPVGSKPLVCHNIEVLTDAGVDDIVLVTGPEHMGHVISLLGSGTEYNCSLTYKVQEKANGIAAALKLCSNISGDRFAVMLGDNIFENKKEISDEIKKFRSSSESYKIFTKKVKDPQRFGVAVYEDGKIVDIIEKPNEPPSDQAIIGVYCYTKEVFDVIDTLVPSARGEYEISDVNSYMVRNRIGSTFEVRGEWIDAGTHPSYRKANELMWRLE